MTRCVRIGTMLSLLRSIKSDKMKIAVPTKGGMVDNHFGHCEYYTIFTVNDGEVKMKEIFPSPQGCGCKSGIAAELRAMGVEVMLAGSMGEGAFQKLSSEGIKVIRGCSGDVNAVVKGYLTGFILDSGVGCGAHEGHHECAHHSH